jgi:anti-sigma regulatory factor (Ser/Thr protein kinase)
VNSDEPPPRLPPWTGEGGRPCYLASDGTGPLSRIADRVEFTQLGLAGKLLEHAREALTEGRAARNAQLGLLAVQLTDALRDALLIAESRGARLAPAENERIPLNGLREMPPLIRVLHDTLPHCLAAPQALGLLSLPGGDLASAGAARRYVRTAARSWGLPPDTADTLETITGELAANALEHTDSHAVTITLVHTAREAIVAVTDEGHGDWVSVPDVPDAPGPEEERGRGLLITDALATRWGRRRTSGGLTVWAEVATTRN